MASMITFFEDKQKLQVQSLAEALFLETYSLSSFKDFHTILTGVKQKQQVLYLGELSEPVGQTRTVSACAMPTGIGTIATSEKVWTPVEWGEKRGFCADEWEAYISQYALKIGIDKFDMQDTEMMDVIVNRISKEIETSHWLKAWFGNTAANVYSGSPSGELIHAKYIPFFNTFNGLFKQMETYCALDSVKALQKVAIAGNLETTFTAQKAWGLTASTVWTDFNKAYEVAVNIDITTPTFVRQMAGNVAYCTRLFYNCLKMNFVGKGLESMFVNLQDGVQGLSVLGVTYVPIDMWDYIIQKYIQNGTKYFDPYRIVLTPKDNIMYGTEDDGSLQDVRTWFNNDENKTYLQFSEKTESKIAMDNMFILGI
jgi:hypothetical protein